MQAFDWNLIRSFIACLDAGSLAAASRQTGISQPTLGRHIDELEMRLGVSLFERSRLGLKPLNAALEVAEAAKEMQRAGAAISMAATGASQAASGTVRITASEIVSTYILPPILAQMIKDLPEIEIELVASDTQQNLLQRDADIAVRMVRPTQNDLITRQVNQMEMGIFACRGYLERQGEPRDFDQLKRHVIIGFDRNDLIIRGFKRADYVIERDFFRFRCDNQIICHEALIAGVGIGFAPITLAARHPQLIRIMQDFPIPGLPLWLTSHRELRTSRRIRSVNDYLGEKLAELELGGPQSF